MADWLAFKHSFLRIGRKDFAEWLADPKNLQLLDEADKNIREKCKDKHQRFWPGFTFPNTPIPTDPSGAAARTFEDPPVATEPPKPPKENPEKYQLDDKEEVFRCLRWKGFLILEGNDSIRFDKGEYRTSDPKEKRMIIEHPYFNLHIFADNPELRALKEWKR